MARISPEKEEQIIREFLSPMFHGGIVPEAEMRRHWIVYSDDFRMYRVFRRPNPGDLSYDVSEEWIFVPE